VEQRFVDAGAMILHRDVTAGGMDRSLTSGIAFAGQAG